MDYLFEIGTEELPAGTTGQIAENLKKLFVTKLNELGIEASIELFSTPRRIALLVKDLPKQSHEKEELVKGPGKQAPQAAIEGFAKKNETTVDKLLEIDGRYCLKKTVPPVAIEEILQASLEYATSNLTGERWMAWADGSNQFSRPVRWLLSLLDDQVFPISLFGLQANRKTRVNRLLEMQKSSKPSQDDIEGVKFIEIASAQSYSDTLRKNLVESSRAKRRLMIEEQVAKLEKENNFSVHLNEHESLIEEIVDLLEWPTALIGRFEEKFLELPAFLTTTVLTHHQRYFPCYSKRHSELVSEPNQFEKDPETSPGRRSSLLNKFVFIANCLPESQQTVIKGNERVLRARLSDGEFFVQEDLKTPLIERKEKLGKMTFLKELGEGKASMQDKADRLVQLTKAFELKGENKVQLLLRAAELCKCDLASSMVFEFPELQGLSGGFIALKQNEDKEVADAISQHYLPSGLNSSLPTSYLGACLSFLDKLDNVLANFLAGNIPTGSSDPYALRRQTQGILELMLQAWFYQVYPTSLKVSVLFVFKTLTGSPIGFDEFFYKGSGKVSLAEFIRQRLIYVLSQKGHSADLIEALLPENSKLDFNPNQLLENICSLQKLSQDNKEVLVLSLAAIRRISRILKGFQTNDEANSKLFKEKAESDLLSAIEELKKGNNIEWESLFAFQSPIDAFFEAVMVEDTDAAVANNRKTLLYSLIQPLNERFHCPDWDRLVQWAEAQK